MRRFRRKLLGKEGAAKLAAIVLASALSMSMFAGCNKGEGDSDPDASDSSASDSSSGDSDSDDTQPPDTVEVEPSGQGPEPPSGTEETPPPETTTAPPETTAPPRTTAKPVTSIVYVPAAGPRGDVVCSAKGVYDLAETVKSYTITTGGVTVKNKTILGNLYLAEGIGDGGVSLSNLKVEGDIVVKGGKNSVVMDGVTAENMFVERKDGDVYLVMKGATNIVNAVAKSNAVIKESDLKKGYDGLQNLFLEDGDKTSKLTVELQDTSLDALVGNRAAMVKTFGSVNIAKAWANEDTDYTGNGYIQELNVNKAAVTYATTPGRINGTAAAKPVTTAKPSTTARPATKATTAATTKSGNNVIVVRPGTTDDRDNNSGNVIVVGDDQLDTPSVEAEQYGDYVRVRWSGVSNASGYYLELRDDDNYLLERKTLDKNDRSYTTKYYVDEYEGYEVRVKALGSGNYRDSDYGYDSIGRYSSGNSRQLSRPRDLSVEFDDFGDMYISWDDVDNADDYRVIILRGSKQMENTRTGGDTEYEFSSDDFEYEKRYTVRVSAISRSTRYENSEYSEETVTYLENSGRLAEPDNVEATVTGYGNLEVRWDEVNHANKYEVSYKIGNRGWSEKKETSKEKCIFSNVDFSKYIGTDIEVRVRAKTTSSGYKSSDYVYVTAENE